MSDLDIALYTPEEKWIMTDTSIYRSISSNEPVVLQLNNITGRIYGILLETSMDVQLLMDGVERGSGCEYGQYNPVMPYRFEISSGDVWLFTPKDERLGRFTESLKLSVACDPGDPDNIVNGKMIWLKKREGA